MTGPLLAVDYVRPLSDDELVQAVRQRGCRPKTAAEVAAVARVDDARAYVVSVARALAEARRTRRHVALWGKKVVEAVDALETAEIDRGRVEQLADAEAWKRVEELAARAGAA